MAAHQITASDLNTFTITPSRQHANDVCHDYNLKSGDELISSKETFGLCEGRAEQHYYSPVRVDLIHVRIWLASTALESVESRVWTAQTTITCISGPWNTLLDASQYRVDSRLVTIGELGMLLICDQVSCMPTFSPLLSAHWLVDDSAAVSLRYVTTRDRIVSFLRIFQLVLLSSHGPLKDVITHTCKPHIHVSPILTHRVVENPRKWVPRFSIW